MTIRRIPTESEVEACLDFTPVPRLHNRQDGWTPDRQRAFIAALARLGTVKAAAAEIGMTSVGAYHLRRQKGAEEFALAWARAHAAGVASLRDIAYDRAVNGTARGVWHKGERVGEERRYNDRLLMFMLRREGPVVPGAAPRLLGGGTRHGVTIEREAKWIADADEALWTDPGAKEGAAHEAKLAAANRILELYCMKIATERRDRLAGDVIGADFALRQATILEVLLSTGPGGRELVNGIRPSDSSKEIYCTPASEALAKLRQKTWEAEGAPLRPDVRDRLGESIALSIEKGLGCWQERLNAQQEAKRIMARGQAMWEAAATEEGWRQWKRGN